MSYPIYLLSSPLRHPIRSLICLFASPISSLTFFVVSSLILSLIVSLIHSHRIPFFISSHISHLISIFLSHLIVTLLYYLISSLIARLISIPISITIFIPSFSSLQWPHNGRDGVSNHQPRHCLFGRRSKKTSKPCVTGLRAENSPVTGEFPHKWPVTRKMFPFDDVIMLPMYLISYSTSHDISHLLPGIHFEVCDEITYPFPNFNGCAVEVWEWISNFITHFTGHVITYPCGVLKLIHVSKRSPRSNISAYFISHLLSYRSLCSL